MNPHKPVTNPPRLETAMKPSISNATPIVFVLDDDISVRESLELLLRGEGWQTEMFASAQDFLARPRPAVPSCLVLDVFLPDFNGLQLQERLAAERVDMPILFITGRADVPTTAQAMKAGAFEFLTKPFEDSVLLDAIRESLEHSRLALIREVEMRTLRSRYASLTLRERQVMALVVSGLLNKQVGGELGINEGTVKAHRGQVMRKMQAASVADLVRIAVRLGPTRIFNPSRSAPLNVERNDSQIHIPDRHLEWNDRWKTNLVV